MSANENTTATSQVNHAGDSTTLIPRHSTGVGSDCWFGRFFLLKSSEECRDLCANLSITAELSELTMETFAAFQDNRLSFRAFRAFLFLLQAHEATLGLRYTYSTQTVA